MEAAFNMVDVAEISLDLKVVGHGSEGSQAIDAFVPEVQVSTFTRPEKSAVGIHFDLMVAGEEICSGHSRKRRDDVGNCLTRAVTFSGVVTRNGCRRCNDR